MVGNSDCDSKKLLIPREGKGIHFQSLQKSRPVPPPLPVRREVWENEKWESAVGVAVGLKRFRIVTRIQKIRGKLCSSKNRFVHLLGVH